MRGTFYDSSAFLGVGRFIPAYAGNMGVVALNYLQVTVHPRVCGEHSSSQRSHPLIFGSSPRMRGTCFSKTSIGQASRFIPAYAGNIDHIKRGQPRLPVHPRVCGEHAVANNARIIAAGSSPRMRGTCRHKNGAKGKPRFIPAYAGNITPDLYACFSLSVHPRVCGEHRLRQTVVGAKNGSSPRMRGTFLHKLAT